MKILLILFFCLSVNFLNLNSQKLSISGNWDNTFTTKDINKNMGNIPIINDIEEITLTSSDLKSNQYWKIEVQGAKILDRNNKLDKNEPKKFQFNDKLKGKQIRISLCDNDKCDEFVKFSFNKSPNPDAVEKTDSIKSTTYIPSLMMFINDNYSSLKSTPFGFVIPGDKNNIVHIFFDQYGNSLLGTIPQGISNAQYMVHIVYPIGLSNPDKTSYSVRQKSGIFNSSLLFNNMGILSNISSFQSEEDKKPGKNAIIERTFALSTSTDDLSFDITATSTDESNRTIKSTLESYTIKMSSVYHGSFDIGLLNSKLSNPTFSLVSAPMDTFKVLKKTDESSKGVITVMATFYTSPIILIEKYILKKNVSFYNLTGRNFLDDHKIYERFYPTIGVSINSNSFQNLFYGINWEIARGLSLFYGWHYGKVNTFEMPDNVEGKTPVSQKQFDYYTKTKWKTAESFGVKVDLLIIQNLFKGSNQ